ncbi:MAG: ferritin [Luteitalea sp.]|nr:ferritin [Luteitalea sp.]
MIQTVLDAINEQINNELWASHSYLAMAGVCEQLNFPGAATWLRIQSDEERGHALKLFNYVIARNGLAALTSIDAPNHAKAKSLGAVFKGALEQEEEVSRQINALYELAYNNRDFASVVELQWFLTEQVEEEKVARDLVAKLELAGTDPAALLEVDRELGARVVTR